MEATDQATVLAVANKELQMCKRLVTQVREAICTAGERARRPKGPALPSYAPLPVMILKQPLTTTKMLSHDYVCCVLSLAV